MRHALGALALPSSRNAQYGFVIVAVAVALCLGSSAAGGGGSLVSRAAASSAALASLCLLLSGPSAEGTPWQRLLALVLMVLGTRVLDAVSGGWDALRLSALALAATATAMWWESRRCSGARQAATIALVAGAAAALSPTSAALLLLPALTIGADGSASIPRRLSTIAGTWALGGGAASLLSLMRGSLSGSAVDAGRCSGAGEWALMAGLFSSPEGLLYGSPLLWLGAAGWLALARREPRAALACGSCWAAVGALVIAFPTLGSRLDGVVPTLALGLTPALAALCRWTRRWPLLPATVAGSALVLWNVLLMAQYRGDVIPRDDTVAFARVVEGAASAVAGATGSPLAWPGNWVAAWRDKVPIERFEWLVGRTLLTGPAAPQATLSLADARTSALLLEGWGSPRPHLGRVARRVTDRAGILVPLACREPLQIVVAAAGPGMMRLMVNDSAVAAWALDEAFRERHVRVGADRWRCPVSAVTIEVASGGEAWIESVSFARVLEGRP